MTRLRINLYVILWFLFIGAFLSYPAQAQDDIFITAEFQDADFSEFIASLENQSKLHFLLQ